MTQKDFEIFQSELDSLGAQIKDFRIWLKARPAVIPTEAKIEAQLKRWRSKSLRKCRNETAERLQELRRLECADDFGFVRCVTCGKVRKYNDRMHGGHYISRDFYPCLVRLNVWAQCVQCNLYKNGALNEYRKFLGPRLANRLEQLRFKTMNFTKQMFAKRICRYRERIKIELERVSNE